MYNIIRSRRISLPLISGCCIAFLYSPGFAGMQDDLQGFFGSMGYASNVTAGGAFQDQTGGYYTGGSVFARAPARNLQLASVQMPNFRSGCGGIDLFTGGFSFINSQALIGMLKTIGSNASSYAFNLALQTVTPQIYNTLNELNALAQDVNNMNINSCEAAATVVGGLWPKTDASSKLLCNSMGTGKNVFKDWAESRQGCGAGGRRESINASKSGEFQDVLGDEFNLAWKAIQKNDFLKSDRELAEFFMSVSGSVISRKTARGQGKKDAAFQRIHLASLIKNPDLLQALVLGSQTATIYTCDDPDENKCLNPRSKPINIPPKKALLFKVDRLLKSMAEKIKTDGKITPEEMGLVKSTMIPIFKILSVQAAFKADASNVSVTEFGEAIAHDILLQYLDQVLDVISGSLKELEKVQIDESAIAAFKSDLAHARLQILERRNGAFQQLHTTLSLIERTKQIEQQLQNMFVSMQRGNP